MKVKFNSIFKYLNGDTSSSNLSLFDTIAITFIILKLTNIKWLANYWQDRLHYQQQPNQWLLSYWLPLTTSLHILVISTEKEMPEMSIRGKLGSDAVKYCILYIILLWCLTYTSSFVFLDRTLSQSPIMLRTAAKYARPTKIQNQTSGLYHFMYSIFRSPPIKKKKYSFNVHYLTYKSILKGFTRRQTTDCGVASTLPTGQ